MVTRLYTLEGSTPYICFHFVGEIINLSSSKVTTTLHRHGGHIAFTRAIA